MEGLVTYFKESYNELVNKVTWPTWSELQSSAVIVLIATLIIAGIIYLMDVLSSKTLESIYNAF